MDRKNKKNLISIKINTTFAIGAAAAFAEQLDRNGDFTLELDSGTTVEQMLTRLPGLGAPENWSDLFLHVFVNHRVAPFDRVLADQDVIDIHIPLSGG